MVESAELVRVDRMTLSGRNRPLRVVVETVHGTQSEAVLKPAGWRELTRKSVVKELIASQIGALLDVPICSPFLVTCSQAMLETIVDDEIREGLRTCEWPAFASKNAGRQWSLWADGQKINPEQSGSALSIFAFDAFLDNPDRNHNNPNLLTKGTELRAIDHELCFSFTDLLVPPQPPWSNNGLEWMLNPDNKNVLMRPLRELLFKDFGDVKLKWTNITDNDLSDILSSLPFNEGDISMFSQTAIERVKGIRNNIDGCITELERILS